MNTKVIIIAAVIVVLLIVGGGVGFFIWFQSTYQPNEKAPETFAYSLGDFIATNAKESRRLVKVDVVLAVRKDGNAAKRQEALASNNAVLRDAVITIIRSRTLEEYADPNIEDTIRQEIKQAISKFIEDAAPKNIKSEDIIEVYFNEFVLP